jgi:two-component system, sensor histidine kinase and response regulator
VICFTQSISLSGTIKLTAVSTLHESNPIQTLNRQLLIVEDEGVTALHLREHLVKLGYEITDVAGSGEQALRILEQRRPDLVLMDVRLAGGLSGTQTAKVIDERFRIPVVYMTAHNDDATLEEINATGGYGFLTKPIREIDLHPIIQLAISRHEKELQEREAERKCWQDLCQRVEGQLEDFTYAAGHDLKEPLRTARSFIELLARRMGSRLTTEEQELITHAQAGLTRMDTLLSDLLAYAQAGISPGASIPETPAEAALKWAIENLRSGIAESGASITYDSLPVVRAVPSQLARVFQNLLANGIKYRRSDPPLIHVALTTCENEWVFGVSDNGIGFDSQNAQRIFAPFKRLHSHREYAGTGIGLAICRKIVEAHGGRMWAESVPERGSVFFFTLPQNK